MAKRWCEEGASWLHLVDLDGAKEGKPVNGASIQAITDEVEIPCQLGGGIRSEEHIAEALSWGVRRVILGTQALKDPEWAQAMCERFPEQIVLGIDARGGKVAIEGWLETSQQSALELASKSDAWPLAALVYTDISRDGMLEGPNFDAFQELTQAVSTPIIASGGVTTLDDVKRLKELNVAGCIIGRSLYEGRIQLPDVLAL